MDNLKEFNSASGKGTGYKITITILLLPKTAGAEGSVEMVFGNKGIFSGTGVLFTRDKDTGEKVISGSVLFNAQGEQVVSGVRDALSLEALRDGYVKSQVSWFKRQNKKVLPPNCSNQMYYVNIGVCRPDNLCSKIKNPVLSTKNIFGFIFTLPDFIFCKISSFILFEFSIYLNNF